MKNIIKDNNATAYLTIFICLIAILATSIMYQFTSDIVDSLLAAFSSTYVNIPEAQMNENSIYFGNMFISLFKVCIVPVLFFIIYFAYVKAQKPVEPYY